MVLLFLLLLLLVVLQLLLGILFLSLHLLLYPLLELHELPGSYGLPKPWYFPFMASYWCGEGHLKTESEQCSWRQVLNWCTRRQHLSVMEEDQACAIDEDSTNQLNFEPEPTHMPLGVHIEGLTKRYKNGKLAVNNLTMNMYEGHITSFLGHNGAGKTTTMSILTGLFPPTNGYARIYGEDIRTDMEEIRRSLGMCPQHNVLFDKLTVDEHLWFYARLKGMEVKDIKDETDRMIDDLGLPKKRHSTTDCLSGGMKRKLSVAIAFVAGSRTVILDEPTAGVDPFARRAIWDLLIKYKQGRTILLSTHHMDEAEVLGDRISIISNGTLKCAGSALFLKSTFGDGYHLTLVKKPSEDDIRSIDTLSLEEYVGLSYHTKCSESRVTDFILEYIPSAYLKWESLQELHYILPFDETHKGGFERLFQALDNSFSDLEISSYGLMDTSLEEVFLKVTENAQKSAEEDNLENVVKENESVCSHPMADNRSMSNEPPPSMEPASVTSALLDEEMMAASPVRKYPQQGHNRTESNFSFLSTDSSLLSLLHEPSMLQNTSSTVQDFIRSHRRSGSHNSFFHQQFRPESIAMNIRHVEEPIEEPQPTQPRHRRTGSSTSHFSHHSVNSSSLNLPQPKEGTSAKTTKHQGNTYHMLPSADTLSRDNSICEMPLGGKGTYVLEGYMLYLQQFIAIIFKRYYYIKRNWKGLFSQILLPALFVCVAMTVALTAPQVTDLPKMVISTAQYYNYTRPVGNYIPYSDLNQDIGDATWSKEARGKELIRTFRMPAGVGATCLLKTPFNSSFDAAILRQINATHRNYTLLEKFFIPECRDVFVKGIALGNFVPPPPSGNPMPMMNDTDVIDLVPKQVVEKFYPECHCTNDTTGQVCRKDGFKSPLYFQAVTSEFLQDITGQQEEKYYLNTNEIYRLHRYGGFTFGIVRNDVPENFGRNAPNEFRKIAVRHVTLVWFNHKGFHSMPVYLNALNNAILRANLPASKGNPSAYGITAINHPMNDTNNQLSIES
ncbi:hypothetical protein CAPTEDRAFT_187351, partial [Capitella teleta]|uniref:ABC transporter domain-containing protein n=1 Tax=Capitella teleta TaxID=283909 RepID=X1ZK58_CAPTE